MSSRIEEKLKTYLGANTPDENEFEDSRIVFEKITKILGILFFGGWILSATFFYIEAVIDFLT